MRFVGKIFFIYFSDIDFYIGGDLTHTDRAVGEPRGAICASEQMMAWLYHVFPLVVATDDTFEGG